MGRDLVENPYGRFYYLPRSLADRGHEVTLLLLDYQNGASIDIRRDGIRCVSEPVGLRKPAQYLGKLRQLLELNQPDWVIGLSDTYFGILAQHYGKKYAIHSCIDAYDNYESYIPWLKPLHGLWRRALARADLVTAAGPDLGKHMSRRRISPAVVVPMTADPIGFRPLNQRECRAQMCLPLDERLIGYCGSLHKNRGIEVLFDAIEQHRKTRPDIRLVLSGRQWDHVPVPESAISLGFIEDSKMPLLLNCMDVLTVVNKESDFGRYSYPVKLYEAMSCQVPVVVTSTEASRWILRDNQELLVPPSDVGALSSSIAVALGRGRINYPNVPDWWSVSNVFEQALQENAGQA